MKFLDSFKHRIIVVWSWYQKTTIMKKFLIAAGVILIIWLSVTHFLGTKQTPQYQTTQADRGSVISTLSESGNVSSVSQTNITSPTNGIIEELYVNNGELVSVGQSLFKVKSTATEQEKASAYAAYLSSVNSVKTSQQGKITLKAQLEQARQAVLDAQSAVDTMNFNRVHNNSVNPSTKQPYTQTEMDSIQSALTSSRENFTAVEAKFTQADSAINSASASQNSQWLAYQATQDSEVKAPIQGTVANLSAVIGSNVSASSNSSNAASSSSTTSSTTTSSSSPVMILGNFSYLVVKAQVNEIDIPKIRPGQKVTLTLDAFPDKTFVGNIGSKDTIGTSSSGVVTYNVYINLIAPPADIQPGMTASAMIQIDRKDDVIKVPSTAVQTSNGSSTVRVLKNSKVTVVSVETGISSDSETEITAGLTEGDTVITSTVTTTRTGTQTTTSPFSGLGGRGGFGGGGLGGGRGGR